MTISLKTLLDDVQQPFPLVEPVDLDKPFHALVHWPHQRIIAITKHKNSVMHLYNFENLQPLYNLHTLLHKSFSLNKFKEIVKTTNYTYNIKLTMRVAVHRDLTEFKNNVTDAVKIDDDFSELTEEQILMLRFKAATLDRVYDQLNYVRSSYEDSVFMADIVEQNRYFTAKEYQLSKTSNIALKNYANEIAQPEDIAAEHLIFKYQEKMHLLELTQHQLFMVEKQILAATTYNDLKRILQDYMKSHERAL